MGFLKTIRDETDDEEEIEAEKRALRELLLTFRVRSQIELPDFSRDEEAQKSAGHFIAYYSMRSRKN